MDANFQQLRKAFQQHDQEATLLINIKVGCLLGMLLVPSFAILDNSVYPRLAREFLLIRLACSAAIGICLVLLLRGVGGCGAAADSELDHRVHDLAFAGRAGLAVLRGAESGAAGVGICAAVDAV
jgi:hypothetical protein